MKQWPSFWTFDYDKTVESRLSARDKLIADAWLDGIRSEVDVRWQAEITEVGDNWGLDFHNRL